MNRSLSVVVILGGTGPLDPELAAGEPLDEKLAAATLGRVEVFGIINGSTRQVIPGIENTVTVTPERSSILNRTLRTFGGFALASRLATFPLGRLLNSLGPADVGRVFRRGVRRNPEAMEILGTADIIIAADVAAAATAWSAVRDNPGTVAYLLLGPALQKLSRESQPIE